MRNLFAYPAAVERVHDVMEDVHGVASTVALACLLDRVMADRDRVAALIKERVVLPRWNPEGEGGSSS